MTFAIRPLGQTGAQVTLLGLGGEGVLRTYGQERGQVRFIGVTGHHDPAVLRRALELYEFDTVLLPINPAEPQYLSFLPLAGEAAARGLRVVGM
ncbi:MAG: hypothetical protein JRI57_06980 [Deltaproteobacteria bacterium]|nr:hypothetical protein [Deltaproteobacteria bacterium]MBW1953219.1 hypothetical protein [Deltaproteobacteria bacterium]MBW1985678.1 hypothetical protein [Deltaproteobacteria bacterium]MBW2134591.1 hypothetical protein [Deltaproteobacteria bacterium]